MHHNTHPPMLPTSHHRVAKGTAFKLNTAGVNHDRQRLDNMLLQRGYAPGAVPPRGVFIPTFPELTRMGFLNLPFPLGQAPGALKPVATHLLTLMSERVCISYSCTNLFFFPRQHDATYSLYPSGPDSVTVQIFHR
jgi:hypothetical protein